MVPILNFTKQAPQLILSILISLFWVLFLWNFWARGVYALGINGSIFLLWLLILFNGLDTKVRIFSVPSIAWSLPLLFMVLSFAVYENPFIKTVNILIMPILFSILINYNLAKDDKKKYWSLNFFFRLTARIFSPLTRLLAALGAYNQLIKLKPNHGKFFKKIIVGLLLLFLIITTLVGPLLASADPDFASRLNYIYQWLADIVSAELFAQIIVFAILSVLIYAVFLSWQKPVDYNAPAKEKNDQADSIISGIVIGGLLFIYLLFLWVQLERLWVNALPVNFKDVEVLVKDGFWQLMFLSVLNIVIFLFTYRKTNFIVQVILAVFTIASLLLLAPAGYRMFLYVIFYGFSYEKFFASYTVLYCAIFFAYLIFKILGRHQVDVIKFSFFLFLWMYGLINIFPVEQFILRANIILARNPNSRIDLSESKILSADVLSYIENNGDKDFMKINRHDDDPVDWQTWIEDRKQILGAKKWYEMNAVNIFYILNKN